MTKHSIRLINIMKLEHGLELHNSIILTSIIWPKDLQDIHALSTTN